MSHSVEIVNLSRREFLKRSTTGGAAFVLGFYLPVKNGLAATEASSARQFAPNAWIRIAADNTVTVIVDRSEMGQGVMTSLPMLVAEELEVNVNRIRTEFAPVDPVYTNSLQGAQGTGGSTSVRAAWEPLRKAGAAAREMLIAAAAKTWHADKTACRAENGSVVHQATGRRLRYSALVERAAKLPVPKNPPLKNSKYFRVIGKSVKRLDTPAKVEGSAVFGIDVQVPGMLHAVVARCPVFGGKVAKFDATEAKKLPGVKDAVPIESGIAVVADSHWTAVRGREALDITWDEGPNAGLDSGGISKQFAELAERSGAEARKEGDAAAALARAAKRIEAVYEVPYLAHADMEPMNCTAHVGTDHCEIWAPTQYQTGVQQIGAKITGLPEKSVIVNTTFIGGGFGRRWQVDFVADAVETSKAVGAPVKVIYTREDDIQHDFYRPAAYNRLSAGLDPDGWPAVWMHRIVSPSIDIFWTPEDVKKTGLDQDAVDGAANMPYTFPSMLVDYVITDTPIPVGYWRSVGNSQNAFVVESFLDEIAAAGGHDPYELRRRLLSKEPRLRAALGLAATKAGWGSPLPKGRYRGIALTSSFASYVAQVAEVSVAPDGQVRVHRVICAVDCGMVVNPSTVEAQMQGAIVFGLTAALKGEITIQNGRVVQSNFHNYEMLRIDEMPVIEVYIIPSHEAPGGIGEPGVPPVAPAVANAVFAATRKRIRRLPIRAKDALAVSG